MPKIPVKQIESWSYSRYSTYKLCPLKAKLAFIDKIKEPPNEAMERGIEIHQMCEDYIKGVSARIPNQLKPFHQLFKGLRDMYGKRGRKNAYQMVVEDNWAFAKDWSETHWKDWVGCWVRIKIDCGHHEDGETLIITDWKTGKFRQDNNADYIEQLELYALAAMLLMPHIKMVKPRLVYLDANTIYPEPGSAEEETLTYTQEDVPKLKHSWSKRVGPMFKDRTFAPRPNYLCSWCFYRKSNKKNGGGQCKY